MAKTPDAVLPFETMATLIWIAFGASELLDAVLDKKPFAGIARQLAVDLDKLDDQFDEDQLRALGQNLGDYKGFRGELLDDYPPRLILRHNNEQPDRATG